MANTNSTDYDFDQILANIDVGSKKWLEKFALDGKSDHQRIINSLQHYDSNRIIIVVNSPSEIKDAIQRGVEIYRKRGNIISDEEVAQLQPQYCIWDYYLMAFWSIACGQLKLEHRTIEFSRIDFFEAFQAGLGFLINLEDLWICVTRPIAYRNNELRFHKENGPAIIWGDCKSWYLHGVQVPQWLVETPVDRLDAREILAESNAEVRAAGIHKIGIDNLLDKLTYSVIHSDGDYQVIQIEDEIIRGRYLRMKNPSTGQIHIEGIENNIRTVNEAIWMRAGLSSEQVDDKNGVDWFQQGDVIMLPSNATKFKSRPTILT